GGKAGQGPSKLPPKKRGKFDNARIVTDVDVVADNAQYEEENDVAFIGEEMQVEPTEIENQTEVEFEDLNMDDQVNVSNNSDEFEKLSYYDWLADSGTTSHITKIQSALTDYQQITCKLKNVLYVPRASNNLVSITRLDREGGHAIMGKGKATLKVRGGRTIAEGKLYNGLYLLESRAKIQSVTKVNTAREEQPRDWLTWH
ncbi:hypothetical protein C8R48DRAFT_797555, partial [Suillus tomentosus]